MTAGISVQHLTHRFAGAPPVLALDGLSLEVPQGRFAAVVGPSGSGKSTLLRVLAGLLRPSEGRAAVDGHEVIGEPGGVSFMPQRDLLLPWRRVLANATLGAEIAGVPRAEAHERAEVLMERFGLSGFEQAWPSQLSGGMRQRLALLRTFLMPRPVLLLDEPFGALDAITRREMHAWLQEVWRRDGRTVMLVTHDIEEALVLADVVYILSRRPGRLVATIDVPLPRPRTARDTTTPAFVELKARVLDALEGVTPPEEPRAVPSGQRSAP
ncbi:MAG: ATP-binding cassette domain-containing protein [Dehalococcoidia bacterium]|nr:ATP-binding cassette domain-containing protein [Dehalococcoidia bacterium]